MVNLKKGDCTGCGACTNICPICNIEMTADSEGFLYPLTDINKCLDCGLCDSVCPIINKLEDMNEFEPKVYAACSLDNEVRMNSTSGGLFTEFAKLIIAESGFVAGARYNNMHMAEHYITSSEREIPLLRQSKYVQSEIGSIPQNIKMLLDKNETVLFVGTPCECAGLLSFLGKRYKNLLLCDFICRGVNSPKAYLAYLKSLEKRYDSIIKKVWFKNKINGWNNFCTKIEFENGREYYADRYSDLFMCGYLKYNLYMRPSCSNCNFKGFPRLSDITLGDFWGIKLKDESIDIEKGISLVIINSYKGQKYFDRLSGRIFREESALETALTNNQCAIKSVNTGEYRDYFFSLIDNVDFAKLMTEIINR